MFQRRGLVRAALHKKPDPESGEVDFGGKTLEARQEALVEAAFDSGALDFQETASENPNIVELQVHILTLSLSFLNNNFL
jgi:hypothetical protein